MKHSSWGWGWFLGAAMVTACGGDSNTGFADGGTGAVGGTAAGGTGGGTGGSGTGGSGGAGPCSVNSDCAAGSECFAQACVPLTGCANSLDCPAGMVCVPGLDVCGECSADVDCVAAGTRCSGDRHCRGECDSDVDCTGQRMLCNKTIGLCYDPSSGSGSGGAGGSGTGGSGTGGSGTGGSGTGGSGTGGSGTGGSGTGGSGTGGSGTGGSGGGACVPNLVLLYDGSGSMGDSGKLSATEPGAMAWFQSGAAVNVGLVVLPVPTTDPVPTTCAVDADCGAYGPCFPGLGCLGAIGGTADSCDAADYVAKVPIAPLSSNAAALSSAIDTVTATGGSPEVPALTGALLVARAAPGSQPRAVVFLTDDTDPTSCNATTQQQVAAVAASGLAGSPSVKTFVIAMGTLAARDTIAQAGGTTQARLVAPGSSTGVTAALAAVVSDLCP